MIEHFFRFFFIFILSLLFCLTEWPNDECTFIVSINYNRWVRIYSHISAVHGSTIRLFHFSSFLDDGMCFINRKLECHFVVTAAVAATTAARWRYRRGRKTMDMKPVYCTTHGRARPIIITIFRILLTSVEASVVWGLWLEYARWWHIWRFEVFGKIFVSYRVPVSESVRDEKSVPRRMFMPRFILQRVCTGLKGTRNMKMARLPKSNPRRWPIE